MPVSTAESRFKKPEARFVADETSGERKLVLQMQSPLMHRGVSGATSISTHPSCSSSAPLNRLVSRVGADGLVKRKIVRISFLGKACSAA